MKKEGKIDCGRRRLIVATAAVGGAGVATAIVPFLSSMLPSERAKAAGAPVEVDIGNLPSGQLITVEWRGKPVWILNRSSEMLDTLAKLNESVADPKSESKQQPDYCKNATRSIKPNLLVAVGICTHLGCSPSSKFKKGLTRVCRRIGRVVSSVPVMVRPSILPVAFTRTNRPRAIWKFRRTRIFPRHVS